MRNEIPMKTSFVVVVTHAIRRTILPCALLATTLLSPTESHASRHRQAPLPSPAPIVAEAPAVSTLDDKGKWEDVLAFSSFLLTVYAIYLNYKRNRDCTRFEQEMERMDLRYQDEYKSGLSLRDDLRQVRRDFEREKEISSAQKFDLTRACQELAEAKTKLKDILLLDPEIETKANEAARVRAALEAENARKQEAQRLQNQARQEGREKLSDLLNQMKRGY